MDDVAQLSRPSASPVTVDSNPRQCASEGFNYPSFRLLNKQARVTLSQNFLTPSSGFSYRTFAAANIRGWFVAVKSDGVSGLIFSPLTELRHAFKSATDSAPIFNPQRVLALPHAEPTILAFNLDESLLFVGFKQGPVAVYSTEKLFLPGSDDVGPLNVLQTSTSPPVEILVNPSTEEALAGKVALLRADGTVQLLTSQLASQGGWTPENAESAVATISWSPKGKQIALGLKGGDILTFAPDKKSALQKHIPATAPGLLSSLTWLPGGHTFRVAYSPLDPTSGPVCHQFVYLDPKTNKVSFSELNYPYPAPDRYPCIGQTLVLPKWDVADDHSALIVVGDVTSVDLEILGVSRSGWFQQSQENPLSLPLDKNQEDTFLLGLALDLTDPETKRPIVYAYLNDGTVQGWVLENTTPYVGMLSAPEASTQPASAFAQPAAPSAAFGQQQSAFSQPTTSAFGQPAAFGSAQPTSVFGQSSFGSAPTFGQSSFGKPGFGTAQPSAFGQSSTSGGFGAFAGNSTPFGQTGFSTPTPSNPPVPAQPPGMIREASMEDSTFGGLSLGESFSDQKSKSNAGLSMFGTPQPLPLPPDHPSNQSSGNGFATQPSGGFSSSSTSSSSFIKPGTGFGSGVLSSNSPFAHPGAATAPSSGFLASSPADPPKATTHPSSGNSSFGTVPAFGKTSALGTSSNAFGGGGGFGAFANNPATLSNPAPTTGGFSGFANGPSSFGSALQQPAAVKPAQSAPFGGASTQSGFGSSPVFSPPAEKTAPEPPGPVGQELSMSSVPPSPPSPAASPPSTPSKPSSTGAFSNLKASVFSPAQGSFGSPISSDSPFLKAAAGGNKPLTPSIFGSSASTPTTPTAATTTPKFGSPSVLGGTVKSAFAEFSSPSPTAQATKSSNAFDAYTSSSSGFGAFSGAKKSFAELSASEQSPAKSAFPAVSKPDNKGQQPSPVFTPPKEQKETVPDQNGRKIGPESSIESIGSEQSFVNVSRPDDAEEPPSGSEKDGEGESDELDDELDRESDFDSEHVTTDEDELPPEDEQAEHEQIQPTRVPLPPSRSSSATPQPDTPATQAASPPTESTTSMPPSAGPSLGLGRPSTKPNRSSPLATTAPPLVGDLAERPPATLPKPRPASPKGAFGVLPEKPIAPVIGTKRTPPESAPPLTSTKSEPTTLRGDVNNQLHSNLDRLTPELTKLAKEGNLFSSPPAPPTGKPSPPINVKPPATAPPPSKSPANAWSSLTGTPLTAFGLKAPPPMKATSFPQTGHAPPASFPTQTPQGNPASSISIQDMEDGMQKECTMLLMAMARDLQKLRSLAATTARNHEELTTRPSTGTRRKEDLGLVEKWVLKDSQQFGETLKLFENDLTDIYVSIDEQRDTIKDLRAGLLKATTRKEEIARFHKAKKENEFSRIIRSRTLGPEHLETQTQLRRKIRSMHTRIHQLEDHIKASKKKLTEAKTGRPSLHAPSLDTINRTYRNIDIAMKYQQDEITGLSARISKLNLASMVSPSRSFREDRDPRLPDLVLPTRTKAMAPNVAVTTAAALNSERSAQKLKLALLSARKQPLLNSTASSSVGVNLPVPVTYNTPQRNGAVPLTFNTPIPLSGPLFVSQEMNTTSFPPDNFSPASFNTPTRRGAGGGKKHSGPVPLKKNSPVVGTGSPESSAGSSFNWGPLPTFNQPARPPVASGFQPISLGKNPTLFS